MVFADSPLDSVSTLSSFTPPFASSLMKVFVEALKVLPDGTLINLRELCGKGAESAGAHVAGIVAHRVVAGPTDRPVVGVDAAAAVGLGVAQAAYRLEEILPSGL